VQKAEKDSQYSFARADKLRKKADFQAILSHKAHKISFGHFIAFIRSNQLPKGRLGILIAKRHIKHAVKRNLIKRIVRESFRHHKENAQGLDIIILLRAPLSSFAKPLMLNEVDMLWHKLNLNRLKHHY
jgi:ribonuclease P protein component